MDNVTQFPDKVIKGDPVKFNFANGALVITKTIGHESQVLALLPGEVDRLIKFNAEYSQPWGDAS